MSRLVDEYTLPEEAWFIRVSSYKTPYFAPGELAKIANFKKAQKQGYHRWHMHHRLELNPDGTIYKSKRMLIAEGLYYRRPADELIFLTDSEHMSLHNKNTHQVVTNPTETTRSLMSEAKTRANGTEERFRLVTESIQRGDTLCFRDYAFYRRYCQRNGIPFTGCKVDKTSKVSTVGFQKPEAEPKPTRRDRQIRRYRMLKARLLDGGAVTHKEAEFIVRFCGRQNLEVPPIRMTKDGT